MKYSCKIPDWDDSYNPEKQEFLFFPENDSEKQIANLLSEIVVEAINHGGDCGGPYYSNKKNLESAIVRFLNFYNKTEDSDENSSKHYVKMDICCEKCKTKRNAILRKDGSLVCPISSLTISDMDFCIHFEPEED